MTDDLPTPDLVRLAELHGIATEYWSFFGDRVSVPASTLRAILKACGVDNIATVNVLEDPEVRQGIKAYSDWPTIPQLYVHGEFVGGSDIMTEMYESGELQALFKKND